MRKENLREFFRRPTVFLIGMAIVVGIASGLGAVCFRYLIGFFNFVFFNKIPFYFSFLGHYIYIFIPAIGALLFSPLIYFFAKEAKGHGVPEVMEAVELKGGRIRPVVAFIKTVASSLCIGSGGSVGREGPIVQIGSALASSIGQVLKFPDEKIKSLVACGAAGGIAATFNAPIGGVMFASEIILRDFSTRRLAGVVVSSVIASVIGRIFFGNQPAFSVPPYTLRSPLELLFYLVFGVLLVPFCILYIQSIYKFDDLFTRLPIHEISKPMIGGLMLGSIGFFYPHVLGVGYENIEKVLHHNMPLILILILVPLKILATGITLGSGGSGGIFSPSLILGAFLGYIMGVLLSSLFPEVGVEPGAYALVGMGAFFAGAAHAPITSILILFELTGDYRIILPLMFTVIITTLATQHLHPESIYTLKLIRRGIDIRKKMMHDILKSLSAKDVVIKDIPTLPPSAGVDRILDVFEKKKPPLIPVVEKNGEFHGVITMEEILALLKYKGIFKNLIVAEDLVKKVPSVALDEKLDSVLRKFLDIESEILPVVKKSRGKIKFEGVISRYEILSIYSKELLKQE